MHYSLQDWSDANKFSLLLDDEAEEKEEAGDQSDWSVNSLSANRIEASISYQPIGLRRTCSWIRYWSSSVNFIRLNSKKTINFEPKMWSMRQWGNGHAPRLCSTPRLIFPIRVCTSVFDLRYNIFFVFYFLLIRGDSVMAWKISKNFNKDYNFLQPTKRKWIYDAKYPELKIFQRDLDLLRR